MNKCCQTCNRALTDHYLCGKTNKIVKSSDLCSDYLPQLDNNGWDAVKEIYNWCKKEIDYYQIKDPSKTNYFTTEKLKGRRKQARKTIKYIHEIIKENGVEINDE